MHLTPLSAQENAWGGEEAADGSALLKTALENTARLKGYHIEAVMETPGGKATLSGDLGEGTLSLKGTDVQGKQKLRIVADGEFYLSTDGGKTWKSGDAAEKDYTMLFSNLVTAVVNPDLKPWEGATYTVEEVELDGEKVTKLHRAAKGKDAAGTYWVCREEEYAKALEGKPLFIRKAQVVVSAADMEFPMTVTYTKLGKPGEIKAPTP
jgi:hypothetical protein